MSEQSTSDVPPGPNDIFRWTTLRALSDHVLSDSMTQRVGMPTVFAVVSWNSYWTSRSMAILGDSSLHVLAVENGAVTAIAISPNQMRVACGILPFYLKILLLRNVVSVRLQGQPHQTKPAAIFLCQGLMAIATPYRLLVLCTKPVPAIIFKMPWVAEMRKSSTDPVVAMSAGSRLVFSSSRTTVANKTKNAEIEFITEGEWDGVTNIVGLQWINNQFIAALMSTEEVVLIDTYNFSETERCDIGVSSIEVASPLSWIDRLTALVRSGGFEDALRMALGFYRGDGVYAATGIPAETVTREKLLGDYISSLLQTYISMAFLTRLCIDTFLNINREDILFSDVFEKFSENGLEQLFFENLEPFILDARVTLLDNPALLQSDYVSPLIELLKIVEAVLDGSEIEVVGSIPVQSRCYTLYIFPVGTLSKRESLRAKTDIYNFLFSQTHIPWPPEERVKSSLLKVLSLALDDISLDGEISLRDGSASEGKPTNDVQYLITASETDEIAVDRDTIVALNIFLAKIYILVEADGEGNKQERQLALCSLFSTYTQVMNP
ncbi:hypothetical protein BC829DRAFT_379531 [Chytridium lagenaria]|nr:hypothetical protein BC829DRAFT_379531 [Chytridium lagenaria]